MTVRALLEHHGLEPDEILNLEVGKVDTGRVAQGLHRAAATAELSDGSLTLTLELLPRYWREPHEPDAAS